MSDSTPNFDALTVGQYSKELTVNALVDASSPALIFGRRQSTCSGLTWGFYGARFLVDDNFIIVANGTITLTASATNYIESTRAGVVSKNTSGFTPGSFPLYIAITGSASVTSYTDVRSINYPSFGRLVKALADANYALVYREVFPQILEFTGALTAQRDITVPLGARQWTVFNNTTGGFGLQFIGATGTGIVVAMGKRAIIYADGTNVVRVTADT